MKPLHLIKNVHGTTVDLLGHAIISGRYAIGASLPPEPLLCEELGVSRTVVREAVKSLVAKGLIITGPKLGTRVLPEEHWNWFDPDVITWQSQNGLTPEFLKDLQDLDLSMTKVKDINVFSNFKKLKKLNLEDTIGI